jgi:hypothetical protein
LVNGQPAIADNLLALFEIFQEIALLILEKYRLDLGVLILQVKIVMTGVWSAKRGNFSGNTDKMKLSLKQLLNFPINFGNGPDFFAKSRYMHANSDR